MEKFKQIVKKPITWILVVAVLLVGAVAAWYLIAGNNAPNTNDDPTETTGSASNTPNIKEKLTWEAINAFPVKSADMTADQLRQLCADFFRFTKTAKWTPKETFSFYSSGSSGKRFTMDSTAIYGGLPYISSGTGNIYRLMEGMDENGAVDVTKLISNFKSLSTTQKGDQLEFFGSQCSLGAYWGWGRVVNSLNHWWAVHFVPHNGVIFLGEYPNYDIEALEKWVASEITTAKLCTAVGQEQMFRNYAQLKLADGLVYFIGSGHLAMCTGTPVVYDTAGNQVTDLSLENLKNVTIDGAKSYILLTDQATTWTEGVSPAGDAYQYQSGVDVKTTFDALLKAGFVPFTFEEFLDPSKVEETVCEFNHKDANMTTSELFAGEVTSNYGISDIYAIVTDASGKEVYRHAVRTENGGKMSMVLVENGSTVFKQGELKAGTYKVEVIAQLSTGERPTVYTGTLTV